jgi:hypothetical protein
LRRAETKNKYQVMTEYIFLEYLSELNSEIELSRAGDDIDQIRWIKKVNLSKIQLTPPSKEMYRELNWL